MKTILIIALVIIVVNVILVVVRRLHEAGKIVNHAIRMNSVEYGDYMNELERQRREDAEEDEHGR